MKTSLLGGTFRSNRKPLRLSRNRRPWLERLEEPTLPSFVSSLNIEAGPGKILSADFDGDGKSDLATGNVSVLMSNGDGTFKTPVNYPIAEGFGIAVGDFNKDGKLDLAVSEDTYGVSVLLGNGDGTFQNRVDYAVPAGPNDLVIGDFNGDGILDIATANGFGTSVSVLLGKGDGTFHTHMDTDATGGLPAYTLVAGDFNNDGKVDLVVDSNQGLTQILGNGDGTFKPPTVIDSMVNAPGLATADLNHDGNIDLIAASQSVVDVFMGKRNGTFATPVAYTSGLRPVSVTFADVNGDGKLDMLVGNGGDSEDNGDASVGVLLGNGDGTFGPSTNYAVGGDPFNVAVGDFNGDGKLDLASGNQVGGPAVTTFLGNGDGTFQAAIEHPAGPAPPSAIIQQDFNGDGSLDLAVASQNGSDMTVILGNGDGSFKAPVSYSTGTNSKPQALASGDFNGDGIPDIAVADTGTNSVSVFLGNGDGTFKSPTTYAVGKTDVGIVVGDFNGDGKLDLVTANNGDSDLSLLLGNGDGTFQKGNTAYTVYAPDGAVAADFNGDGKLDLATFSGTHNAIEVFIGNGTGMFQDSVVYTNATYLIPAGLAVGDFNGDGHPDFVETVNNGNGVGVLLNNGDGTFQPAIVTNTAINNCAGATVGDFDGDGKLDVAVGSIFGYWIDLLQGNGDGTFSSSTVYNAGIVPTQLVAGHFGGTALPDLAVADNWANTVTVLLSEPVPSDTFVVAAPKSTSAGAAFDVTVTALTPTGVTDTAYAGTVHFTSSDGQAVLPGDYTFTTGAGNDNGVHTFSATLKTAGTQSVTATDTATARITGTQLGIAVNPASASKLILHTQPSATATAGVAFATQPVIYEEDVFGNLETGDNTTQVTASLHSGTGPLQGTATVTVSGGVATFTNLADNTAETISLDFTSGSLTKASSNNISVTPAAAGQLVIQTQPSATATAGQVFATQPLIYEEDSFGNLETGDNSTKVTASLHSGAGPLQGTAMVTVAGGIATFTNLADNKAESIALDFTSGSLTKATSKTIVVSPAQTSSFAVKGFPSPITSGLSGAFTVTAQDAFGNATPAYLGTVAFTSNDPLAVLPTNYTFTSSDAGTHSFSATLKTAGSRSITATDTGNSSITGSQLGITVNPAPSDDQLFVSGTFHDLLGRAAGTQELGANAAPIDVARFALLPSFGNRFVLSTEFFADQVKAYYLKYLGRSADSGGLAGAVQALQTGTTDEQIIAGLVGSGEFFAKNGGTNLSFLQAAYLDILGRKIDPSGQASWLAALQNGVSRFTVATALLGSTEYRTKLVTGYYAVYLGRNGLASEITGWVNALGAGVRDETVIDSFVGSAEYFKNPARGGNTDKAWLASLYQVILNRSPDTGGFNSNLASLLSAYAGQRQTEVAGLTSGKEFRTNQVNAWYQKYLNRAADPGALAALVPALQTGQITDEQVIASLVGSPEFLAKNGKTNLSFLQAAYLDILGRAIDSAAQASWLAALQAGMSRITVATALLGSAEYQAKLVNSFYSAYLGRTGANTEVAGWLSAFTNGATDEQVIGDLLMSNEYFLRAHVYP